jgi:hypothetical protein
VYVFRATLADRADDLPGALGHLAMAASICAEIGLTDTTRTTRLQYDMVAMLSGADPSPLDGAGSPDPGGTGWYDGVLTLQVTALREEDTDPLRVALDVLARVRGSGAVSTPLLNCLRVARRLGADDLTADCRTRLIAAARAKGDTWLLDHVQYS